MLRERLRFMELKITELADYLQVSRPTMYKFIEYYDNAEFDLINKKVLKLFNYINDHELVGKKNVINYILNNLVEVKDIGDDTELDAFKKVKKYLVSNPESKKGKFISTCVTKNTYDDLINYLVEIQPLIKKRKLTEEEMQLLQPYLEFKNNIKNIKGGN